jgi:hypothetical protein
VLNPRFGSSLFENDTPLDRMFQSFEEQTSDAAQILLSMGYDITTKIFDHMAPANIGAPMANEMAHEEERYSSNSGLYRSMERYERQNIKEKFGLSLIEYQSLPRDYIEKLSNILISVGNRNKKAAADAKLQAENEMGSLPR